MIVGYLKLLIFFVMFVGVAFGLLVVFVICLCVGLWLCWIGAIVVGVVIVMGVVMIVLILFCGEFLSL